VREVVWSLLAGDYDNNGHVAAVCLRGDLFKDHAATDERQPQVEHDTVEPIRA